MINSFDFFKSECAVFKTTPDAHNFINTNGLNIPAAISDIIDKKFNIKFISGLIDSCKESVSKTKVLNKILFNLSVTESFLIAHTTEVILITNNDCGKEITVLDGNWLYMPSGMQIKKPFVNKCDIPSALLSGDHNLNNDKLGLYVPKYKVIFLWVDRILHASNRHLIKFELLFDSILLHEMMHSLLDCNHRDNSANVYGTSQEYHNLEESLANTLMLKILYDCDQTKYQQIIPFVKSQPLNYASAAYIFPIFEYGNCWESFGDSLVNFLRVKTENSGTKATYNYFVLGDEYLTPEEQVNEWRYNSAMLIEESLYCEITAQSTDIFYHKSYQTSYNRFEIRSNDLRYTLKNISIYSASSLRDIAYERIFFSFYNDDTQNVIIGIYDATHNEFTFPLSDNLSNKVEFKNYTIAREFCSFLNNFQYNEVAEVDILKKYIPKLN